MNSAQESISTIRDNLSQISNLNNNNETNQGELDKTGTVTDIINKNINNLEDYINTKVINIYQRPWNKLEQKLKFKKVEEYFVNGPTLEDGSSDEETSKRKKKGVEAFTNFTLSQIKTYLNTVDKKRLKVDYDDNLCRINSIIVSN